MCDDCVSFHDVYECRIYRACGEYLTTMLSGQDPDKQQLKDYFTRLLNIIRLTYQDNCMSVVEYQDLLLKIGTIIDFFD